MAKLTDLVRCTSEVTGIPVATVREVSRRLREDDLIQTGKGGRYGGAEMTASDAASLLTALLIMRASSHSLSEILPLTKIHLRSLKSYSGRVQRMVSGRWDRRLGLSELCQLKPGHSFEDALTELIASFVNNDFERAMPKLDTVSLFITVANPRPVAGVSPEPEAKIEFETGAFGRLGLFYLRRREAERSGMAAAKKWSDIPQNRRFDLGVSAQITEATLKSVGLLLRNSEATDDAQFDA
jgi:hypothetical protein